jgi:4-amino-4-deoxy-L-arabinose transferase-like glycosyltransferase
MNGRHGGMGGPGGLLGGSTPSAAVTKALSADAGSYTWAAAAVGANNAAGYQLATGRPVMALGGFNGTDPSPTLAQFKTYVADGKIHYFVGASTMGGPGGRTSSGSQAAQDIASWVKQHYTARTVGGVTLYDLSK